MRNWRFHSFIRSHHVAVPLLIAAVLILIPARQTGIVRYRVFARDLDIPGYVLVIAALVIGFLLGNAWARLRHHRKAEGRRTSGGRDSD
jgi:hypothetical protein